MSAAVQSPGIDREALCAGLAGAECAMVQRARDHAATVYAGRQLSTGEDALEHALGMTACIAGLNLDADARAAGHVGEDDLEGTRAIDNRMIGIARQSDLDRDNPSKL